jgi:hypothetical protein
MAQPANPRAAEVSQARLHWELEQPDRTGLPQAPGAQDRATWPAPDGPAPNGSAPATTPFTAQTLGISFSGATLGDTGAFPPDVMGAVGPTQFVVFVNGRIRTFSKFTGLADGVINADPDVFFFPVMTPVAPPVVLNFTSDPQIRYDRLSGRWFLTIIDVPCTNFTCSGLAANRLLIAVSDAASAGTITPSTVWTLFFFKADPVNFLDYPSLGVDAKALYIGGDMFNPSATAFLGTNGFVVQKSSVLGAGPVVVTTFVGMAPSAVSDGPLAPRGVDNVDPTANEGYFIGPSNVSFGSLVMRRVSDPGGTPAISANIPIAVNTTSSPRSVAHLGNTGGSSGNLDALDDRLYAAHIRNGRLWTAHNIAVDASGIASNGAQRRDAVRWYELNGIRSSDNGGTPVVVQSGTIFDNAATVSAARQYWIPSVMVSGQGHAALGFSTAGAPFRADAATTGRLAADALGETGPPVLFTSSSTAYNPGSDPGGGGGRRWGDYSLTSLDPIDDMTLWTVQEYCNSTNSYACQVVKLIAPPPATPASVPAVEVGAASVNVVVTGESVAGSGFYDPGPDLASPAPAFSHLSAVVTNAGVTGTPPIVKSVAYLDATHVQLGLDTSHADPSLPGEKYSVAITNPDGQSATGSMILEVDAATTAVLPGSSDHFRLESIKPNPSTGRTEIAFTVGREAPVQLSILDLQGREIVVLAQGVHEAGRYVVPWDGRHGDRAAAAGVYFVRYRAAGHEQIRRMALTP